MSENPHVIRILIVEDSPTQAKKLQVTLESAGYAVAVARNGREGLAAFAASPFDLVLSDVVMPEMSGYDLCRALKAAPRGKEVPIILLTSLSKPIDMIRGLECGADNFVNKPYERDHLIGRITTLLANHSLRAGGEPEDEVEIAFMGERFTISSGRRQVINFLASTFEDFVRAKQREYEGVLARQKQALEAEAQRARETLLIREKEGLCESQRFLQSTLDALSAQIAILDDSSKVLAVNAAWGHDSGGNPLVKASSGMNYLDACQAALGRGLAEAQKIAQGISSLSMSLRDEFFLEYPWEGPEGKRWFSIRATRFDHSRRIRVVVAHEEITQRKMAEEQLHYDAFHDALTGLPNRALFLDRLNQAIARAARQQDYHFAVLFLDLDGFKVVNDSLGHTSGDQFLIALGRRMEAGMRRSDTLARLGGDEFAILADDIAAIDDAVALAGRIQAELRAPINLGGHEVFATVSVGIAFDATGYERPEDFLRDADTAMYRAKAIGKGRHVIFDTAMHTSVVQRLKLESDLRRAFDRQEFRVHYQPIVSLETGRIAGFEALVRWGHPERGCVSPSEFIPVAEETGLIHPLGLWVLRESCRQLRTWQSLAPGRSHLMISVNLSGRQLAQPDFMEQIDRIIGETEIDPRNLKLEITESVLMEHPQSSTEVLERLKERGIRLSLDDFGTGYSSLSYLHRFPLDILKIDRSFVSRLDGEAGDSTIIETIIALAHHLGMQVVAEGVETEPQVERLRALGCQYGQGFFYSRPVAGEKAAALLDKESRVAAFAAS